jgi:hypothetical protein
MERQLEDYLELSQGKMLSGVLLESLRARRKVSLLGSALVRPSSEW